MKVMKFGGTSVGSAQRMKNMVSLVAAAGNVTVVLSAMSGTTNSLIGISQCICDGELANAAKQIDDLEQKYITTADELLDNKELRDIAQSALNKYFAALRTYLDKPHGIKESKETVAYGEKLSTMLVDLYMKQCGLNSILLDATRFMKINKHGEPDLDYIRENLKAVIKKNPGFDIYLTQGFICRNDEGEIDNLQRGGSDYTASLIGAAINADEIQIWTDIDGMHNNDPRFVEGTRPVGKLHFEEAAELAYFGAKILHPSCVLPAKLHNIPVRLLNTMQPEAPGTLICNTTPDGSLKAIAAKDNITAVKIKSGRMLLAYGFLHKVFETFENYRTSIDMMATSEVGVSVTIDDDSRLAAIIDDLKHFGTVSVDSDMVIICVVGDLQWEECSFQSQVLEALEGIPVRMISYGGSNYNISVLVRRDDKVRALKALSNKLFK